MDQGWKRVHLQVILLIFCKHAFGFVGLAYQNVQPWNEPFHKTISSHGVQSPMMDAPVIGSSPAEEVGPKVFTESSQNPSRSRFPKLLQFVKGGGPSSYESMSRTQSGSVSASLALPQTENSQSSWTSLLQGSSGSDSQNAASLSASEQGSLYSQHSTSQGSSGTLSTGGSGQLASPLGGSGSALSIQSQSTSSQSTPVSLPMLGFSPLGVPSQSGLYATRSQGSSGLQLGGTSNQFAYTQGSSISSVPSAQFQGAASQYASGYPTSTESVISPLSLSSQSGSSQVSQVSPSSQTASSSQSLPYQEGGSSSYSALSPATRGTSGQYASGSTYTKLLSAPARFAGQSTSRQGSLSQSTSTSQGSSRLQTVGGTGQVAATQGGTVSYSGFQSQGAFSQFSKPISTLQSASSPPTHGYRQHSVPQASPVPQLATSSRFSLSQGGSSTYGGSSLLSQGTPSQLALGSPSPQASLTMSSTQDVVSQATPSAYSLSQGQMPQRWKPSASKWAQGFQTSDTSASLSTSASRRVQAPSRFSSLSSAAGTSQLLSTRGASSSYSGFSPQPQGTPSQFSFSSPSQYASLSASSPQGIASQYSQATPMSQSKSPQRPQPSASRWTQGVQTSGAAASLGTSPSQSSQVASRVSSLSSVAGPSQSAPTLGGSEGYSSLSLQGQGTSSQYASGSPAYAKLAFSPSGASSQPTSDQSSYSLYTSSSQRRAGPQLAAFTSSAPEGSSSPDGLSPQPQGIPSRLSLGSPSPYASLSIASPQGVTSQAAPSAYTLSQSQTPQRLQSSVSRWTQGVQTSGLAASQSGPLSQSPQVPSRLSSLSSVGGSSPLVSTQGGSGSYSGQSTSDQSSYGLHTSSSKRRAGTQLASSTRYASALAGSGSPGALSLQPQVISNQYTPASSLFASAPSQFNLAIPSGSLSPRPYSQGWQASASSSAQGIQTTGTAALQSSPTSSGLSSYLPALSPPVFSVAQSGQTSTSPLRTHSVSGAVQRPSKIFSSSRAPSGSPTGSQTSTVFASLPRPADSIPSAPGSNGQAASGGRFSGSSQVQTTWTRSESAPVQSFSGHVAEGVSSLDPLTGILPFELRVEGQGTPIGSASETSSSFDITYGQNAPVHYRPPQTSSGRYSSVKG